MANAKTLRQLDGIADQLTTQADRLQIHIFKRRVSHTQSGLKRLLNYVAQIMKHMESDKSYADRFEKMMFQCQGGPLEITRQKDLIYIQGIVRIDALKEFILVNEPPGFDALEIAEKGK